MKGRTEERERGRRKRAKGEEGIRGKREGKEEGVVGLLFT